MVEQSIVFNNSSLNYLKAGKGSVILLAFHGFGQDHTVFKSIIPDLFDSHTVYLFDLFFHGKSRWADGEEALTKAQWKEFIALFLKENKIEKFTLIGFSLGAKFVFATLESFPTKVEKIVLIAPDGVKTSFWYSLATYPYLLRRFFKGMILHPNRFLMLVKLAHTLRLADKGLLRFAEHQMNAEKKRRQVYYAWVVFRHLKFDMKTIAMILNNGQIPLTFILGDHDKVITKKNMRSLSEQLTNYKTEILQTGHNGLLEVSIMLKSLT